MTAVLRRGAWVVVLVAVLGAALAAAYVVRAQGQGVSSEAQLVVTGRAAGTSQDNAYTSSQYVNQRMSTYAEVATSDAVLVPAAEALGVAEADLADAVTATVPLQTTVLALAVAGDDPAQAQARGQAVLTALSDQITTLETQTGDPTRVDVRVLSSASLPAAAGLPSVPLAALGGFAAGVLLGLAGLAATHLLRPRDGARSSGPAAQRPARPATPAAARPAAPAARPVEEPPARPAAEKPPARTQADDRPAQGGAQRGGGRTPPQRSSTRPKGKG